MHRQLAEAGFAVHSYDHHGHGRSEPKERGERALIHSFDHLVRMQQPYAMCMVWWMDREAEGGIRACCVQWYLSQSWPHSEHAPRAAGAPTQKCLCTLDSSGLQPVQGWLHGT